jgi:hypothetical protein
MADLETRHGTRRRRSEARSPNDRAPIRRAYSENSYRPETDNCHEFREAFDRLNRFTYTNRYINTHDATYSTPDIDGDLGFLFANNPYYYIFWMSRVQGSPYPRFNINTEKIHIIKIDGTKYFYRLNSNYVTLYDLDFNENSVNFDTAFIPETQTSINISNYPRNANPSLIPTQLTGWLGSHYSIGLSTDETHKCQNTNKVDFHYTSYIPDLSQNITIRRKFCRLFVTEFWSKQHNYDCKEGTGTTMTTLTDNAKIHKSTAMVKFLNYFFYYRNRPPSASDNTASGGGTHGTIKARVTKPGVTKHDVTPPDIKNTLVFPNITLKELDEKVKSGYYNNLVNNYLQKLADTTTTELISDSILIFNPTNIDSNGIAILNYKPINTKLIGYHRHIFKTRDILGKNDTLKDLKL